jgi:hypothetical protein
MAGITGLGTTYNLPNFVGELFDVTPSDTPFLSAIGGLTGGVQAVGTQFEWQGYDLRSAGQNTALEGAAAPTAQERVRFSVNNVCQVHQEAVKVSYTKQAAVGQHNGLIISGSNPVTDEVGFQVSAMLKQIARDAEWSFLNGSYNLPVDNTTTRKTRGLLAAIATTRQNAGSAVAATLQFAADTITKTAHGLVANDQVVLDTIVTTTGLTADVVYYVSGTVAANTFQIATTRGGAAIDMGTADGTANYTKTVALTNTAIDNVLQSVFDNGGITESETATLICNSSPKRALTAAYANLYGKHVENTRNVGGVNLTTIETDFGVLNIMLDRHMPQHKVAVVSLDECAPVFLEIPGKGHLFVEDLAKTGASIDKQIYGELGLKYGNEKAHGLASNFLVT